MTANLPLTIDEHAIEYLQLQNEIATLKAIQQEKKAELVKLVQRWGPEIPAGAEKSLRVTGDEYQITISFGQTSSIDKTAVGKLQAALAEQKTPSLFRKLFQIQTSYIVSPAAAAIVQTWPKKLADLFTRCTVTKAKEPSLKVEKKAKKDGAK